MTDNISRLYRLNNIDKVLYVSDDVIEDGYNLNSIKEDYPQFTLEKQLELIKWLAIKHSKYSILHIDKYCNYFRVSFDKDKIKDDAGYEFDYAGLGTDFPQALAGLACELWEDLTPEQREEIKRILE